MPTARLSVPSSIPSISMLLSVSSTSSCGFHCIFITGSRNDSIVSSCPFHQVFYCWSEQPLRVSDEIKRRLSLNI